MFVCLCLSANIISATFRPVFTIFSAARSTDRSITAFGTIRELGKKVCNVSHRSVSLLSGTQLCASCSVSDVMVAHDGKIVYSN